MIDHRKRSHKFKDVYESKRRCHDVKNNLPVYACKNELLELLKKFQIMVVTGETGSGKSTQIPQYLMEAGYSKYGKIVCTQPRRVGAISLANRVSEELNCALGDKVGYSIRFEKCVNKSTNIIYMTDGVLLRELQTDPNLDDYSVVIIDEAHERTIQTDALLGIMKNVLKSRPKMRLIISSATLNAEKFAEYYSASIFRIPSRLHRVKIVYSKSNNEDYMIDIIRRVLKIHRRNVDGDVLIFLAGQEDIDRCVKSLNEYHNSDLYVLPAYSSLPKSQLSKIFDPSPRNTRKIVVATNIAETSLTIEGIQFVIDSGFVKQKTYNSYFGIDQLLLTQVSQAQANQRAGRAGRTSSGKCYRIYSHNRFHKKMLACSVPEIQRANLSNTVLQLKSIGIDEIDRFPFIDPPNSHRLSDAIDELTDISALSNSHDGHRLTNLGHQMAQLPLEPILSKILIMSAYRGCSEEALTIVAMLCVQNVYDRRPSNGNSSSNNNSLHCHQGDHITLLHIYRSWRASDCSTDWCREHSIRASALEQARNVRRQLAEAMRQARLPMVTCGSEILVVQNTLSLYYFRRNGARKDPCGIGYRTLADEQTVFVHPSSALFARQPEWVVFHDVMATSNRYMREVTKIDASFLRELVPYRE